MRWLGHVCRMDDGRQPKKLLFGELMKSRPFHGAKQHWRDVVNADLKILNIPLNSWYDLTFNRIEWFQLYTREVVDSQHPGMQCTVEDFKCGCGRSFHHQGDLTRHLRFCDGHPKVVQRKLFECSCRWIFHCQGDLTRHLKYCKEHTPSRSSQGQAIIS